ncbi:hypothetical protein BN1088_1431688 [Sphingobacterium sp. PM2-P1-29]|nr:hypothetical protein BN1088_1431688 [Sphingobacterium sp. PM2-P1-29]
MLSLVFHDGGKEDWILVPDLIWKKIVHHLLMQALFDSNVEYHY